MMRRTIRRLGSTNRYTDGTGRNLDTNVLPRDLYVQKISNRAYPQETEHWQVAEAGTPSPFKGNVMISGAGVVGSTTAAMFALRGWHVTVVEQKPSPAERMEATADAETAKSASDQSIGLPNATAYDEIDCALLTRRGLDIFAAAGLPLEHLRHFGQKVEGIMEHPDGYNSVLTRNLTEEHQFAVNMLSLDMARLREHLDTHLKRLPGANCKVFYNHQVVAAFPEKKRAVVKSMEEILAEKKEREQWREAYDAKQREQSTEVTANTNATAGAASSTDTASAAAGSSSSSLATTGPKDLSPVEVDNAKYDGLKYDLLIDAEGPNSKLRDMLDVEGFAADKIYGMKWFALDEVVEVTMQHGAGTDDGEFFRNPNFSKNPAGNGASSGGGKKKAGADGMLEEDEYGRITQREKLRILKQEDERRKDSVRKGTKFEMDAEEAEDAPPRPPNNNAEEAESAGPDQRFFYLEKSHIHRWTYPCPKGTGQTAVCIAFPRGRSVISTADNDDASSNGSSSTNASTVRTTKKYRNSYSVMAYFPMSTLRKLSDEEFLKTYLHDLSFERRGFLRAPKHDEFNTFGVSDGLNYARKGNKEVTDDLSRISYFELETPSKPTAPSVAKFSTRGKITPYPTVFCEDLYNGVGLPSAVVVGDAAHCVNPFMMQNLSIALEDSSILLNQLDALSRHFYDSVKQFSRERGVAGDSLRIITERSLYYNRAKHVNPFIRLRNAYGKFMYRMVPAYYNEYYSTNMNHLYPRSVEWMLNGRGYTSFEKTEMTQTKLQRYFYLSRNYT